MKDLYQQLTIMGRVSKCEPAQGRFELTLLNGERLTVGVSANTYYEVLRNVGDGWRDRVEDVPPAEVERILGPHNPADRLASAKRQLLKYIEVDRVVTVQGIYSQNDGTQSYDARRVVLSHYTPGRHGFEDTHWWLQQIETLFEQWLDVLFGERREITVNDFAERYRTNLDLLGGTTANVAQECATMSRFLYGLSSSYLLTGNDRALSAARACANYLVDAFSIISHDRRYCFWKFGRVYDGKSTRETIPSENTDDRGSFALYEQIYALSGLAQYYRITQDTRILNYIMMTIAAFEDFYRDEARPGDPCFTGKGGYFSHIDTVTMRPDSPALAFDANMMHFDNIRKKNWNSIGDHIPAYLVNLLLALDPLPVTDNREDWARLRRLCRRILDDCVDNILDHFFKDDSPFVNERFDADWNPDLTWGWQQNRGVVGHNLKISWNLTRCAHYYKYLQQQMAGENFHDEAQRYADRAKRCYNKAIELGDRMDALGVDQLRGGIWDVLERLPDAQGRHEFAWGSTKDFWQQEQAILAYYIMQGIEGLPQEKCARFLELARACTSFWNLFFVDQDNRKIFFRTDESGAPVISGQFGIQAGHAIAGYHAFELNYLAHIYMRSFVEANDDNFALTFRPICNDKVRTLNVLPDFMPPGEVAILSVRVNGLQVHVDDPHVFQIDVSNCPEGAVIQVEFRPVRKRGARSADDIHRERKTGDALSFSL